MKREKYLQKLHYIYDTAKKLDAIPATVVQEEIEFLSRNIQNNKAVVSVLITCVLEKEINQQVDCRKHQSGITGGFSGRSLDTRCVTPFLKEKDLPHMAESGWLTRSLEQPHAYTLDYPGKIRGDGVKPAFLKILDELEKGTVSSESVLVSLFFALLEGQSKELKEYVSPFSEEQKNKINSTQIFNIIKEHINSSTEAGSSKLPVLLLYAILTISKKEHKKLEQKKICPLKSHTASDKNSQSFGDIEIVTTDNKLTEVFEVKHNKTISIEMIKDCFTKISNKSIDCYTIMTTGKIDTDLHPYINQIKITSGHSFLIFNIFDYLSSFLTTISNPVELLEVYADLVMKDKESMKDTHKIRLNSLISQK